MALAGVSPSALTNRHQSCPSCDHNGIDLGPGRNVDRYRWDRDDGPGGWFCSHCGGRNHQGGGGTGMDLLLRLTGWSFPDACRHIEAHLGLPSTARAQQRRTVTTPPPSRRQSPERTAWELLSCADALSADDQAFSPAKAKGRRYTTAWTAFQQANPDAADAATYEHSTAQGIDSPPPGTTPPESLPPPLLTLDQVRAQLRDAIDAGASRQDLEAERIRLAAASDIPAATLRDLLTAIQREAESTLQVQQEARRLAERVTRADGNAAIRLANLLPPLIADALQTRTRYLPSDDLAATMALLVTVSGVVKLGTELIASRAADYRVPLNLYSALVARSGAKKSPLSKLLVSKPTEPIRLDLARQHSRAMQEWTEAHRNVKPADRPDPPRPAYLAISDFTAEALTQQLQTQENSGLGLLINRDELAAMFGNLNQYRSGRGSDSEQLLEAYDGGGFRSLRVAATGGGRSYNRCHLSIWGTIQPAVLQALIADGDAAGLWARFLFIPLPEVVVAMPPEETENEATQSEHAADLLERVCGHVYRLPRASLTLDPDARAAFMAYEARCQAEALAATIAAHGALIGKAAGKVLRVAGLLHLLWAFEAGIPHASPISPGQIERAILLVDRLNAWTLGIHEAAAAGDTSELMRLLHRISTASGEAITWRDVAQRLTRRQRMDIDSAMASAAADALSAMDLGTVERGPRGAWHYKASGVLP